LSISFPEHWIQFEKFAALLLQELDEFLVDVSDDRTAPSPESVAAGKNATIRVQAGRYNADGAYTPR
jgi:hypothetical protein